MESSQKRKWSGIMVALFGICLLLEAAFANDVFLQKQSPKVKEDKETLTFWYTGDENEAFFLQCADDFWKETGIAVSVAKQQSLNYFSGIYDATELGEEFPDVYLLGGEELEKAYFSQLIKENPKGELYRKEILPQGIKASSYGEKLLGYPLYFETYVFAYRNGYFEAPPTSIQEMLSYSAENDPGEEVERLFEWNLSDSFYNFAFFGAAETLEEKDKGMLEIARNEEIFSSCAHVIELLSDNIALEVENFSEDDMVDRFLSGKSLAVLLNTNRLKELEGVDVSVSTLPAVTEGVPMRGAAKTTMLCVNQLSEQTDAAEKFADYVASKKSKELWEMTGHVPVKSEFLDNTFKNQAAAQYEAAMPLPSALNAVDYWVKFQNTVLEIWNGTEL